MDAPDIKTPLPGPKAQGDHRARRAGRVAVLHARLSVRHGARRRRGRRGRRRQPCSSTAPPASPSTRPGTRTPRSSRRSSSRRRSSCTCRARTSTTSRRCGWRRSWRRSRRSTAPSRSFFGNSGTEAERGGDQAGALRTRSGTDIIAFLGAFHGRTMGSLSLTASKAMQRRGLRAADAGRVPRAVRGLLPLPGRPDAGDAARPSAWTSSRTSCSCTSCRPTKSPRSSSSRSRARAATSCRRRSSMQRLRELTTQHGILLIVRRSAVRHGPHRQDVRHRALRRRARHRDHREGHRVGHAARRRRARAPR